MQAKFERLLSLVLTVSAVVVAASVVYRTFYAPGPGQRSGPPTFVKNWTEALAVGTRVGDEGAPITIVDVADLQCPVCRGFYKTVSDLQREYPRQLAVVHVSYPLSYHAQAMPAARAAECASERGRFREWIDVVYRKQDSLGVKPWTSFAGDAGIADSMGIARCATDTVAVARIQRARAFGDKIGVTGTPTVLVNGWRLPDAPTTEHLKADIEALLNGQNPYSRHFWTRK